MHSPDKPAPRRTTTISHRIDLETYLKAQLVKASSKLKNKNPPDLIEAGQLDRIVATAEFISSGLWSKLEKLYEPFSPKLQITIKNLNDDLASGKATALTFDEYIGQLVAKLNQPVTP